MTLHAAVYAWGAKTISPGWVLDLGSECGFGSAIIAETNPHLCVLSIDIDFAALQVSKDLQESKRLTNVSANAIKLPVPDHSMRGIFLVSLLHLVEHPSDVLSEVLRVLKPGGIAIISIPSEHYFPIGRERVTFLRQLKSEISSIFATAYYPDEKCQSVPSSMGQRIPFRNFDGMWIGLCLKGDID